MLLINGGHSYSFKRIYRSLDFVCFYSIGSLGKYLNELEVSDVIVQRSTLIGTDNGLRIKAWPNKFPGSASNIIFAGITMDNVRNPIIIDEEYQCNPRNCKAKVI